MKRINLCFVKDSLVPGQYLIAGARVGKDIIPHFPARKNNPTFISSVTTKKNFYIVCIYEPSTLLAFAKEHAVSNFELFTLDEFLESADRDVLTDFLRTILPNLGQCDAMDLDAFRGSDEHRIVGGILLSAVRSHSTSMKYANKCAIKVFNLARDFHADPTFLAHIAVVQSVDLGVKLPESLRLLELKLRIARQRDFPSEY